MGGLLRLVQRGGAWAGCGPAKFSLCCIKCNSLPNTHQQPLYQLHIIWCVTIIASELLRVKRTNKFFMLCLGSLRLDSDNYGLMHTLFPWLFYVHQIAKPWLLLQAKTGFFIIQLFVWRIQGNALFSSHAKWRRIECYRQMDRIAIANTMFAPHLDLYLWLGP